MTDLTRRTALYGLAAGSAGALAGCAGTGDSAPDDGGDGNGSDGDGNGGDSDLTTAVQQAGGALSGPAWDRDERRGICLLIADEDEGAAWPLEEAPERVRSFVEETDFSESVIAYVESVGPTTCDGEIAFDGVGVEDGTLVADATVEGAEDDDVACGEAITYSGALLRVTSDPLPEAARISVTDGWDERGTVRDTDALRDPELLPGGVRPDGDPATVPASFDCGDDGFERHPRGYDGDVNWGAGGGTGSDDEDSSDDDEDSSDDDGDGSDDERDGPLALRVVTPGDDAGSGDDLLVARGEEFRIELTNLSGRRVYIGNEGKYNLEVRTEEGWTEIRGADGDAAFEYTDEAIGVRPGETLAWEFEMTESGLVEGGPHADALRVCPELVPGRYRFVFWGAADLAVAFDYDD